MEVVRLNPTLSIIVPAFNEADCLPLLYGRVASVMHELGESWELVFVNDGSTDSTLDVMQRLRAQDERIAIVNLSRNFGKEVATTSGLVVKTIRKSPPRTPLQPR